MQASFVRRAALLAGTVVVASCSGDMKIRTSRDDQSTASFSRRDTVRVLGPGDVRITNADSTVEVAVIGDSIVTGLAPRVVAEIREKTDTSAVSGSGFAAGLEKFVKSTVANALDHEIRYPIADVRDVRYEDGRLQFYWKDGSRMKIFENTRHDDKPLSETFREADASRFVSAFRARKAALGTGAS